MGTKRDRVKRAVRKTVKWGGAGLTVLLVVVWVHSYWWYAIWIRPNGEAVDIRSGRLHLITPSPVNPGGPRGFFSHPIRNRELQWWFYSAPSGGGTVVAGPLWLPFLLSLLATAAAWRADLKYIRRARAGLCGSCGYDRAGLPEGGVCPECGGAAEA